MLNAITRLKATARYFNRKHCVLELLLHQAFRMHSQVPTTLKSSESLSSFCSNLKTTFQYHISTLFYPRQPTFLMTTLACPCFFYNDSRFCLSLSIKPTFVPSANVLKLSTVLGTVFPKRPMTILPVLFPPISMSKNTYKLMRRGSLNSQ